MRCVPPCSLSFVHNLAVCVLSPVRPLAPRLPVRSVRRVGWPSLSFGFVILSVIRLSSLFPSFFSPHCGSTRLCSSHTSCLASWSCRLPCLLPRRDIVLTPRVHRYGFSLLCTTYAYSPSYIPGPRAARARAAPRRGRGRGRWRLAGPGTCGDLVDSGGPRARGPRCRRRWTYARASLGSAGFIGRGGRPWLDGSRGRVVSSPRSRTAGVDWVVGVRCGREVWQGGGGSGEDVRRLSGLIVVVAFSEHGQPGGGKACTTRSVVVALATSRSSCGPSCAQVQDFNTVCVLVPAGRIRGPLPETDAAWRVSLSASRVLIDIVLSLTGGSWCCKMQIRAGGQTEGTSAILIIPSGSPTACCAVR
ncbi:hypothetical protein OH77DRAFT_1183388 [Trametes cingulata]|nr:hypothetical protein OH77DRAFT_1183388 [Trametes cingulata]